MLRTVLRHLLLPLALAFTLAACEGKTERVGEILTGEEKIKRGSGKVFGDLRIGGIDRSTADRSGGIGVNGWLWRASLDALSFLPLAAADPFGGVIITDWYAPPESPAERFKVTVYILGTDLRSDGLRVSVFRQERRGSDAWADSQVGAGTASELENAILTRARELRIASAH
ncbi:MAG: DUF3576 domain-containing protein [Alphaproteobacteria bacterium]|nr:DUF3576 domain-containing protein [Alphaproteobacteria bacterium]